MTKQTSESGNGGAPVWCQGVAWINGELFSTGPLGTYVREIWIKIRKFAKIDNDVITNLRPWMRSQIPYCDAGAFAAS